MTGIFLGVNPSPLEWLTVRLIFLTNMHWYNLNGSRII